MLKNSNVEVVYQIERYTPDIKTNTIKVEIAIGSLIDNNFVSDNRGLIYHTISNVPEKTIQKVESLTVNFLGQVILSEMPIDNNPIEVGGSTQDHTSGQTVICDEYSENDQVTIKYYYNEPGRDWFAEAAAFRQVDHPECIGMSDYEYNSHRLWSVLVEMGLISGTIV